MKKGEIRRYLNPVAQLYLITTAPYSVCLAGRGFSKSFTNGLSQANKVALMPRSLGLFNSPTYNIIYTKTLIPMKAAWEQHCGYIEGVHYVVGKAPPKHFVRPWHRPQKFENVVSFWNGRAIVFGSFDRPELISGGSYDDVETDEAYMIEKDDYDNYVIPTVRGTHPSFRDVPIHLQQKFSSSMPHKNMGDYLLDYYEKAKRMPNMYSFIGWEPNARVQMGSTWMNVHGLPGGRKAIEQMIAEMDPFSVRIMIDNQRVTNYGNVFYPELNKRHWYTPKANSKLVSMPLGASFKRDATYDESPDDYHPDKPLFISHDWGTFNCITIAQEHPREVRFTNTMHVLSPNTIDDLADEFADYYRHHKNKMVYQFGDKSGTARQANSKRTYFEQFADRLMAKGWRVMRMHTGDVEHLERHRFIANMHREEDPRYPRVRHNSRCTDLRIALEATQMKDNKKDKSSERNDAIKPQHATHYTDAYDYFLYHRFKIVEQDQAIGMLSGIRV